MSSIPSHLIEIREGVVIQSPRTILGVDIDPSCNLTSASERIRCASAAPLPKINLHRYDETPTFLQASPYIQTGYRVHLPASHCVASLFLWSNETVNIWTHLIGFFVFLSVMMYDIIEYLVIGLPVPRADLFYISLGLICFQSCMLLSSGYHLFHCHSEKACRRWLALDLAGICLGIIGCYLPAVHLAFYCHQVWRDFYLLVVTCLAVATLSLQFHPRFLSKSWHFTRMALYCSLAGYGVVPTMHWVYLNGGPQAIIVKMFLEKIVIIYLLAMFALIFYSSKFPERCLPGRVDIIGSSHQVWHVIVVVAFLYWHNAAKTLLQHRLDNPCIY